MLARMLRDGDNIIALSNLIIFAGCYALVALVEVGGILSLFEMGIIRY